MKTGNRDYTDLIGYTGRSPKGSPRNGYYGTNFSDKDSVISSRSRKSKSRYLTWEML